MGFFHESLPNKIKIITYTAISNGISNVVYNLNYNPVTDDLNVTDLTYGQQLSVGDSYTENANLISIDLIGWTLNIGEKISFRLTKNVK
ncbi:MAG TPA: hypothetical protein VIM42_10090 [Clostridium sp.]